MSLVTSAKATTHPAFPSPALSPTAPRTSADPRPAKIPSRPTLDSLAEKPIRTAWGVSPSISPAPPPIQFVRMSPPSDKSQSHTADPSRANGRSAADGDLPHQHSRFVAGEMAQVSLVFASSIAV